MWRAGGRFWGRIRLFLDLYARAGCVSRVLWMPLALGAVSGGVGRVMCDRFSIECDFACCRVHASGVVFRSGGQDGVCIFGILALELVELSYKTSPAIWQALEMLFWGHNN